MKNYCLVAYNCLKDSNTFGGGWPLEHFIVPLAGPESTLSRHMQLCYLNYIFINLKKLTIIIKYF